jgi:hypothetical protein
MLRQNTELDSVPRQVDNSDSCLAELHALYRE